MGATQTTFCNESEIPVSTGLSVVFTYYFTKTLLPQECVTYKVGRVWFTAFAHFPSVQDPRLKIAFGDFYFLMNETTAVGLRIGMVDPDELSYLTVTPDEVRHIVEASHGFITSDFYNMYNTFWMASFRLYTRVLNYYAGSHHKFKVNGGPTRVVRKIDKYGKPVYIFPHLENFRPLELCID